jgi:hypothetical protein
MFGIVHETAHQIFVLDIVSFAELNIDLEITNLNASKRALYKMKLVIQHVTR